jgi:hypothetical protein
MYMTKASINPTNLIETQEVMQKLRENGYSDIIDCLIDNEKECYTKKGRLNKSSTCRKLSWKGKKLEDCLKEMRILLQNEYDIPENELRENFIN